MDSTSNLKNKIETKHITPDILEYLEKLAGQIRDAEKRERKILEERKLDE